MVIGDLIAKVNAGQKLSEDEAVYYIRNYPVALAAFMVENNPGNVNFTLRKIGYDNLNFQPDQTPLARQLQLIIERGDTADWSAVVENFQINTTGLTDSFVSKLQTAFSTAQ